MGQDGGRGALAGVASTEPLGLSLPGAGGGEEAVRKGR